MDKDILGMELYNTRNTFSNKTVQQLIDDYGSLENARIAACKAEAETIIKHIQDHAVPRVPGTGLAAGATPVTGLSTSGSII